MHIKKAELHYKLKKAQEAEKKLLESRDWHNQHDDDQYKLMEQSRVIGWLYKESGVRIKATTWFFRAADIAYKIGNYSRAREMYELIGLAKEAKMMLCLEIADTKDTLEKYKISDSVRIEQKPLYKYIKSQHSSSYHYKGIKKAMLTFNSLAILYKFAGEYKLASEAYLNDAKYLKEIGELEQAKHAEYKAQEELEISKNRKKKKEKAIKNEGK